MRSKHWYINTLFSWCMCKINNVITYSQALTRIDKLQRGRTIWIPFISSSFISCTVLELDCISSSMFAVIIETISILTCAKLMNQTSRETESSNKLFHTIFWCYRLELSLKCFRRWAFYNTLTIHMKPSSVFIYQQLCLVTGNAGVTDTALRVILLEKTALLEMQIRWKRKFSIGNQYSSNL